MQDSRIFLFAFFLALSHNPNMELFKHQADVLERSKDLAAFALFWQMGTGKSCLTLRTAAHLKESGEIDAVLVVAPNGVHRNWIDEEIPRWLAEAANQSRYWESSKAGTKRHQHEFEAALSLPFVIVAITYEGFMTERALKYMRRFLSKRRVLMVLDESTKIKSPSAKRTSKLVAAGRLAKYRRILTGTPVANSPFDVYTQMRFLDDGFWRARGFKTLSEFKVFYGNFKSMEFVDQQGRRRQWNQIVSYRNLAHLQDLLAPVSSRVLKEDVLDLPPKMYSKRYFDLSKEQQRVYRELRDEQFAVLSGGEIITAALAMTVLLRLQQVTSNYLPNEGEALVPIDKTNPRLQCLADLVEEVAGQAIIWARFREDVNQIMGLLGDDAVRYDGAVSSDDRVLAKNRFQAGEVKYFVANPAAAATGLTLTAAKTVIYYSNSFRLEDRLQSEDRAHRIGQDLPVQYIDIVAPGTVDMKIVGALRDKVSIASAVTGDPFKEWI